jgi:hypothetical protein
LKSRPSEEWSLGAKFLFTYPLPSMRLRV